MGFSLAATCGLRAFLPLFIIGLVSRAGYIDLAGGFEWMSSWQALVCFGAAMVLEILGDKIPAVDHILDAAGIFVRPIAGAIAASSLITGMDPLLSMVIGIIMGASVAGAVQAVKGAVRLVSTSTTAGIANPAISIAEDGAVAVGGIVGIFAPYITAAVIIAALVIGLRVIMARLKKRREETVST